MNPLFCPWLHLINPKDLQQQVGLGAYEEFSALSETWRRERYGFSFENFTGKRVSVFISSGERYPTKVIIPWRNNHEMVLTVSFEEFAWGKLPSRIEMKSSDPKSIFNYVVSVDLDSVLIGDEMPASHFEIPQAVAATVMDHDFKPPGP